MRKEPQRPGSLPWKLVETFFMRIPIAVAKGMIQGFQKIRKLQKPFLKYFLLGSLLILILLLLFLVLWFLRTLSSAENALRFGLGLKAGLLYLAYLVFLMPFFLVLAYFSEKSREGLFQEKKTRNEPDPLSMRRHRLASTKERIYLGESFSRRKPVYLTNDQRLMHTEVVGSTGTGKTESVLLPLLAHDISHKKGAIVIDGKGDLELLDRILYIVNKKRRLDDFYFFSLTHPEKSNTYNPLLRGNATELKDKLVGSIPWSDEFYRRMAEQASLTLLNALVAKGEKVRFKDLHTYLTDVDQLDQLAESTADETLKEDLKKMGTQFKNNPKFISGLMADLFLTARSEFSNLVNVTEPEIDLLDVYTNQKIVYFQLNLQGYGDTAKRMGRMILQDIRTVSSHIQSRIPESKRHFFPVFIDDASSFLDVNFIDFLNKARASQYAITLLHQSPGDLVIRRDFAFQQQVIENTNIKIILRQDDPQSVEKLTKIGGTQRTVISTYQTEEKFLGKDFTGVGSMREAQAFCVDPDLIRRLKRGEAVLIWKSPSFHTDYVKLDFFGYPPFSGLYESLVKKRPPEKEIVKKIEPKTPEQPVKELVKIADPSEAEKKPSGEIEDPLARVEKLEGKEGEHE